MIKRRRKKGAIHVEMVISFVIFISFVVFLLILFNPLKKFSKSTSSLDITKAKIIDYVSTDLSISSLTLKDLTSSPDCFYLDSFLPDKVIIKNENLEIVEATKDEDYIYFKYTGKFYKIYSSEELEEREFDIGDCEELAEANYIIGVTRTHEEASYSKFISLKEEYNDNYQQLKQDLGLKNDFNIIVRDSSGIIIKAEKYKPKAIEIMAEDISIQILDEEANLNPAVMNIQVWE